MKMTKPTQKDMHAAMRLVTLLDEIAGGEIDHDDLDELQQMIGHIEKLIMQAPEFYNRVIGGMRLVIMSEDNKVVDPSSDVLDYHPETKQALKDTERLRFLFCQLPGQIVRSIVGEDGMSSTGELEEIRTRLDDARERSRQEQINQYGKVLSEP